MHRSTFLVIPVLFAVTAARFAVAAGQTSTSFRVEADVFCAAAPAALAAGSAHSQASLSVAQYALVATRTSTNFRTEEGFQAAFDGFDIDHDGIPDQLDPDCDEDGIPDGTDSLPYDTDNDGENNLADSDDDGDRLADTEESQYGTSWVRADTDGDSQSDYEEVRVLHTDGTDSDSCLQCLAINTGQVVRITWYSSDAVTNYWIQISTNAADGESWTTIAGPLTGSPGTNRTSYTDSSSRGVAVYRLKVPYD